MGYLSYNQLIECLNSSDSVYKKLSYKIIKENIIIPSQQKNIKNLSTYTFKFAPEKLNIAHQIILSTIHDSSLLIAYSFDIVLTDKHLEDSFYLFTGHSYFSLYNPNAENLLTQITRLQLQELVEELFCGFPNLLFICLFRSLVKSIIL